jgi:hypothetical protein
VGAHWRYIVAPPPRRRGWRSLPVEVTTWSVSRVAVIQYIWMIGCAVMGMHNAGVASAPSSPHSRRCGLP